jgi:hypothetical protein
LQVTPKRLNDPDCLFQMANLKQATVLLSKRAYEAYRLLLVWM